MIHSISQHNKRLMIILDIFNIIIAFFLGYFLRSRVEGLFPLSHYVVKLPIIILIYYSLLHVFGAYASFRAKKVSQIISVVFKSSFIGFLIFGSSLYILKIQDFSRSLFLIIYLLIKMGIDIDEKRLIELEQCTSSYVSYRKTIAHFRRKQYQQAWQSLLFSLKKEPENSKYHYAAAVILAHLNKIDENKIYFHLRQTLQLESSRDKQIKNGIISFIEMSG